MAEQVTIGNSMFYRPSPDGNAAVAEAQAIQRKDSEEESQEVDN